MIDAEKKNHKCIITNFIFILVVTYFVSHSFIGDRGYIKMLSLKDEINIKKDILSKLKEKRKYLENKVGLINDKSINQDYLDELTRKYFGLIKEDEVYILEG